MIGRMTTRVATIALVTVACAGGGPELTGTWEGEGPDGETSTWEFAEDGTLTWDLAGVPEGVFDDLSYEVVSPGDPREIDITGFAQEPMAGQALYCIAEFPAADSLRIDCAQGPADDDASRPDSLGPDALGLTRVEAGGAEAE